MRYIRLSISLCFFITCLTVINAYGQSSAELKRRKAALTREIQLLNRSLKSTSSHKNLSLRQINNLNARIRLREKKINTINSQISLLDNQISQNSNTIYNLQSRLNKLKKEYADMILFAFRNQSAYNKLMFIFAAKDFNQAYKRLKYLSQFSQYRKKQAEYIQKTEKSLKNKIAELDQNKKEKSSLLDDVEDEKQTLGREKSKQTKVYKSLSKKVQSISRQLATRKKEAARLNRAIQAAITREIEAARKREEARLAAKSGSKTAPKTSTVSRGSSVLAATPEAAKLSSSFLGNRGKLPWPVAAGAIVEGFGKHSYGVNVTIQNNGVDIKTAKGATVRAVYSGVVSTVQNLGGNYAVLIRHGEYFTVYSNLRHASVSRGQKVSIKQAIGTVLTDPTDGSTQVHFEIRKGALPLNPSSWLAR